jgi:hypothetical protein
MLSSLPLEILKHLLYERTFGDRDFEVIPTDVGRLKASRQLGGCTYEFVMGDGGDLRMFEHHRNVDVKAELELLDNARASDWGAQLPCRLRELYSHWLDRASGAVYIRPKQAVDRTVLFVMLPDGDGSTVVRCHRVPVHLQSHSWHELSGMAQRYELYDVLALLDNPPAPLAKFERPEFTHFYHDATHKVYRVEMPRFNLEFSVEAGTTVLRSDNFAGYHLAPTPQLSETLLGFTEYFVIAPDTSTPQAPWSDTPVKVIVPTGTVTRAGHTVAVNGSQGCDAKRKYTVLEVHPRLGELRASSVEGRLQLAALYAASNSLTIPEPRAGMSGAERSIELVRQCFVNAPLSTFAADLCRNVAHLAVGEHALFLVCELLLATARQLDFLHVHVHKPGAEGSGDGATAVSSPSVESTRPQPPLDSRTSSNHKSAYLLSVRRGMCNARRLLTDEEEKQVFGCRGAAPPPPARVVLRRAGTLVGIDLEELPIAPSYVQEAEDRLQSVAQEDTSPLVASVTKLLDEADANGEPLPTAKKLVRMLGDKQKFPGMRRLVREVRELYLGRPFPLPNCVEPDDSLGADMIAELKKSWETNEKLRRTVTSASLNSRPDDLHQLFTAELSSTRSHRAAVEAFVMKAVDATPQASAPWDVLVGLPAHRLRRAAGLVPVATMPELVRSLWEPSRVGNFNPYVALSDADVASLRAALILWLELCVLENKLERLERMAFAAVDLTKVATQCSAGAATGILAGIRDELLWGREWPAADHPQWLAFEVDGGIQIRPEQYEIAKEVMNNPGAVVQLNMGLGKTRVIVPMLLLHWRYEKQIVRI